MKYGLIKYLTTPKGRTNINDVGLFNVGDNIQMLAIKRLLTEELKIDEKDIVEIDFHELRDYVGEYLIVPINLFFFGCHDSKETWFPASPYIIPVFIGVHFSCNYLTEDEIAYLRYYSPIGCRDEFTLATMRKYNIPSYLYGCVTATLPARVREPSRECLYLVDVDQSILDYIPNGLKTEYKIVNHVIKDNFSTETYRKMDEMAVELLNDYSKNASIIITSRLHCASPCAAMGIPTIMVVKEKSIRYAWLDKIIPIYTQNDMASIDWRIEKPIFEKTKNRMIELFVSRMKEAKEKHSAQLDISEFWEFRKKDNYVLPFQKLFDQLESFSFDQIEMIYIWGATALAEDVYLFLSNHGLLNKFSGLIDEFNVVNFYGKESVPFNRIERSLNERVLIIVTPTSAANSILELIESKNEICHIFLPSGEYKNIN